MIPDYSIENLLDRIQDARSREYMDEVLSSYYSGNYRSAVVMLYSVVMCDLIYKLQHLKEVYSDNVASDILDEVERLQTASPSSPVWENKIREELLAKSRLITPIEAAHIEALQKDRHLCAHPVLKNNAELHRPARTTVHAHIINALSEILTRPALLEKELLTTILADLSKQRRHMRRPVEAERYILAQYLTKINNPEIEVRLFGKLWKFVFKLNDAEYSKSRGINLHLLNLLYTRNEAEANALIVAEREKLSRQIDTSNFEILYHFVKFANLHPKVYHSLGDAFKISFNATMNSLPLMKQICFFLHDDMKACYNALLKEVTPDSEVAYIIHFLSQRIGRSEALYIPIQLFARSDSFDEAGNNYNSFIRPYLGDFDTNHFTKILDAIRDNGQIRYSFAVKNQLHNLVKAIKKTNEAFDFSQYDFIK